MNGQLSLATEMSHDAWAIPIILIVALLTCLLEPIWWGWLSSFFETEGGEEDGMVG